VKSPADHGRAAVREALALVGIFLLALSVRIAYRIQYDARYGVDTTRLSQLDSSTFDVGARIVLQGDVLQRRVYYPYHWWNEEVAPRETWEGWYRPPTYHQTPLYLYFVAALYALFGSEPGAVRWMQALLGACVPLLVYSIGRRPFGRAVSLLAALWSALLAPLFFYDAFVLRESLFGFLVLVTAACFERALRSGAWPGWWVATGAALGLAYLAKEITLALIPVLLAWPLHPELRGGRFWPRTGVLVAGFILVLLPVVARNVAVGARPLVFTTRGPWEFVNGNASASGGVEWFAEETRGSLLRGQAKEIFLEAEGSFARAATATLRTHAAEPLGFLALQWRKLAAFWNATEIPNNVDFHSVASRVPILRFCPAYWPLAPLALLGLVLSASAFRERFAAFGFVLLLTAATVAVYVVSRFRVPVLPFLALFASSGIGALVTFARAKRWRALAASAAAAVALGIWTLPDRPQPGPQERAFHHARALLEESQFPWNFRLDADLARLEAARPSRDAGELERRALALLEGIVDQGGGEAEGRYENTARFLMGEIHMRSGQFARAEAAFRDALEHARRPEDRVTAMINLGNVHFHVAAFDEALALYEDARREDPENAVAHFALGRVLYEMGELERAAEHLLRAVSIKPEYADAHAQLGVLYHRLGQKRLAVEHLRRGLEGQTNPSVLAALRQYLEAVEAEIAAETEGRER
jgi:tetratricopeptide (TPR) repeat protein